MPIKFCSKCKKQAEFYSYKQLDKQRYCIKCTNRASKEYYSRHRQKFLARAKLKDVRKRQDELCRPRRDRAYKLMYDYLSVHPCVDCGEDNITVLEFDHVIGVKTANIATLAAQAASYKRMMKEITKCEVVCANCHRKRTYKRHSKSRRLRYVQGM